MISILEINKDEVLLLAHEFKDYKIGAVGMFELPFLSHEYFALFVSVLRYHKLCRKILHFSYTRVYEPNKRQ